MESPVIRPLPFPEGPATAYWEAARAHRLAMQYCDDCARFIHPPALSCPICDRGDLPLRDLSGRGTLNTYTVVNDAPAEAFVTMLPYVVGVVELVEQARLLMVTNIVESVPTDLRVGQALEVTWDEVTPECTLPQFRPLRED